MLIALPGIKPTNPTGRFKIKKFLLLISVMVEPLLLQDQDLKLPTDSDQQIMGEAWAPVVRSTTADNLYSGINELNV